MYRYSNFNDSETTGLNLGLDTSKCLKKIYIGPTIHEKNRVISICKTSDSRAAFSLNDTKNKISQAFKNIILCRY